MLHAEDIVVVMCLIPSPKYLPLDAVDNSVRQMFTNTEPAPTPWSLKVFKLSLSYQILKCSRANHLPQGLFVSVLV